jgi:AbrB family looped-hinge helix DNA binding protein
MLGLTMQILVSTKGRIVLPRSLRRQLGIRAGDMLDVDIESGRIVLMLRKRSRFVAKITEDPVTGFPALDAGPDAPVLTSEQVRELLADFP